MTGLDILSSNPLALRVHTNLLVTARIDLDFYLPSRVEAEEKVNDGRFDTAVLDDLRTRGRKITDGIRRHDKADTGVHLIRTQNLVGPDIDFSGTARISEEWHNSSLKSEVQPGDLLIAIRGYLGSAAIVRDGAPKANINQHIARVAVDRKRSNIGYLWAFFCSKIGRQILERYVTGTVQRGVTLPDLRSLRIPLPDRRLQDYIGAKVELVELCRSEGLACRVRAMSILREQWELDRLEKEVGDLGGERAHMVPTALFGDRLDAEYYQPWHLHVSDEFDRRDCWTLRDLIHPPAKGVQPAYELEGSIPALTVTHIDPFIIDRRNASQAVTTQWLGSNERARIHTDEVLITVTGPPLGETVVVEDFHLPAAINSHIARVRMQNAFPFPNLLAAMLNSPLGQWQTTRYCKGIRQKEIYPEDLLRFRFPKLPRHTLEGLENDFRRACVLLERARVLVDEAKADVEAVVDGTLDTAVILSGRLKAPTYAGLVQAIATKGAR